MLLLLQCRLFKFACLFGHYTAGATDIIIGCYHTTTTTTTTTILSSNICIPQK
jgi:hypothetical protein